MLTSPKSIDPEVPSSFSTLASTTPPGALMLKIATFLLFPFFLISCAEETPCLAIAATCAEGTIHCDPDTDGEACVEETFGEEGCEQTLYCMDDVPVEE